MNPGGLVVVIAAVWLGCQIWGGDALERLGVLSRPADSSGGGNNKPAADTTPAGPSADVMPA